MNCNKSTNYVLIDYLKRAEHQRSYFDETIMHHSIIECELNVFV